MMILLMASIQNAHVTDEHAKDRLCPRRSSGRQHQAAVQTEKGLCGLLPRALSSGRLPDAERNSKVGLMCDHPDFIGRPH